MKSAVFNALVPARDLQLLTNRRSRLLPGDQPTLANGSMMQAKAVVAGETTNATATALNLLDSAIEGQQSNRFILGYKQVMSYAMRAIGSLVSLDNIVSGTATAGAAGTITLAVGSSASNDAYNDMEITTTGGTGSGQVRRINDYVGSTRVASVSPNWSVTPDNTTTYAVKKILCTARATAQAGGNTTITLVSSEPDALASKIVGLQVEIMAGTGIGQVRTVASYVNSTKVATVSEAWDTNPDNTSVYIIKYRGVVKTDYTAQAGGGDDEIIFPAAASEADDFYNGLTVSILSGTGAGQELAITDYDGATQTATMADDWDTNPDATSVFALVRSSVTGTSVYLERKGVYLGPMADTLAEADTVRQDLESETLSITPIGLTALDIGLSRAADEEGGIEAMATGIVGATIKWEAELQLHWLDLAV